MSKFFVLSLSLLFNSLSFGQATVEGQWTTIDDEDGQPSSIISIEIVDNELTATIKELLTQPQDILCENCSGDKHNQPIVGMQIITNMKKNGSSWSGGKVLDPKNGKTYKCKVELEGKDKLKMRGYIGIPALGRTQVWERRSE